VLRDLEHEAYVVVEHLERREDRREATSKRTSTTAPITWHTCPTAPAPVNSSLIFPPFAFPAADAGDEEGAVDGGAGCAAEGGGGGAEESGEEAAGRHGCPA